MYSIEDYSYQLPEELIAQKPFAERDQSRLLTLDRRSGNISHHIFSELDAFLRPSDVLVINNTRVVPGRLVGKKETGGRVEVLIVNYATVIQSPSHRKQFDCMIKSSKPTRVGARLYFSDNVQATVTDRIDEYIHRLSFTYSGDFADILEKIGKTPLPPYIKRDGRQPTDKDRSAYQTIYASQAGAIAAPTAGFHFTDDLMQRLKRKGIRVAKITLHVGYGTFLPVRANDIRNHRMHSEWFVIPPQTASIITGAKKEGHRVVAVGTTAVRTLEYAADESGKVQPKTGDCDLYIYPGYQFRVVDTMITNFHLPKSTLLMLVSAFAGRDNILSAYETAIQERYRFYSYGDAMLIH